MIAIGSDHGGFELKEKLKTYLSERGVKTQDFGCFSSDSVDYPDIAKAVGTAVAAGEYDKGILVCGTGIGISIAANKIQGIRAALCGDVVSARLCREHNDANILCLGGRIIGTETAYAITNTFLEAEFAGERHKRRVDKISAMEL